MDLYAKGSRHAACAALLAENVGLLEPGVLPSALRGSGFFFVLSEEMTRFFAGTTFLQGAFPFLNLSEETVYEIVPNGVGVDTEGRLLLCAYRIGRRYRFGLVYRMPGADKATNDRYVTPGGETFGREPGSHWNVLGFVVAISWAGGKGKGRVCFDSDGLRLSERGTPVFDSPEVRADAKEAA